MAQCISEHGNAVNLLTKYNSDTQLTHCADVEECFKGSAPALATVKNAFGAEVAEAWIEVHLKNLFMFSGRNLGKDDKYTTQQIEQVAVIILMEYGYLKLTELMFFFLKFKAGVFGTFYGAIDGMIVTSALRKFTEMRLDIIRDIEKRRRKQEDAERMAHQERNAVTFEEWRKLRGIKANDKNYQNNNF